jgi:transcriptional regulator GlxA family with amidase domain
VPISKERIELLEKWMKTNFREPKQFQVLSNKAKMSAKKM